MVRCPFSLDRVVSVSDDLSACGPAQAGGKVVYRAEKADCQPFPILGDGKLLRGVSRNFEVFDPLDFLADPARKRDVVSAQNVRGPQSRTMQPSTSTTRTLITAPERSERARLEQSGTTGVTRGERQPVPDAVGISCQTRVGSRSPPLPQMRGNREDCCLHREKGPGRRDREDIETLRPVGAPGIPSACGGHRPAGSARAGSVLRGHRRISDGALRFPKCQPYLAYRFASLPLLPDISQGFA